MKWEWPRFNFLENLFTRQERLALLFVLGVSLLGFALLAWRNAFPPAPPPFICLEVHVNRADLSELTSLPGVGPILARRIIEDKKRHGRYLTLEDLKRVKGITPKILERLNGMVRFD